MKTNSKYETILLQQNGWVPNNPDKPVLLYRDVLPDASDAATAAEELFVESGWQPQWRDVVFRFHHYHTTAHEVLGCVAGHASIMLGGEDGTIVELRKGDAVLLPAGVGHAQISASDDFLLVGAYPPGQQWDLCRTSASEADLARIRLLPFPLSDPVFGKSGPMTWIWKVPASREPTA